jgi:hypothetical protein
MAKFAPLDSRATISPSSIVGSSASFALKTTQARL